MSTNICDVLKEKFANVDVEQVASQINEEIKKSIENMENKLQTGMIMDGVSQTEEQKQAKENLNEAVGINQEQIMQAMANYKAAHTILGDYSRDYHDECAGRTSYEKVRAAEEAYEKACHDGGDESLLRAYSAGYTEGNSKWKRYYAHYHTCY